MVKTVELTFIRACPKRRLSDKGQKQLAQTMILSRRDAATHNSKCLRESEVDMGEKIREIRIIHDSDKEVLAL